MGGGFPQMLLEDGEVCGVRIFAVELGVSDGCDGFAELADLTEDGFASGG